MLTKLQQIWIMARTLWITLYYSLAVMIYSVMGKLTRERVNCLVQRWANKLLNIVKLRCVVVGDIPQQIPERRYILMSNHASHYDIPITITVFSHYCIRMIAKKELFQVPIWGQAMRHAEFMAIDREDRKQALQDLAYAKAKLSSGITTWVAPEGTRTRTGQMGDFKKGPMVLAIQTEAIIIPFFIQGSFKVLPADSWNFSVGEQVTVKIGEPIDTRGYDLKQRHELMAKVHAVLQTLEKALET